MKHDLLVVGGGLAGLVAGLGALERGLSCAVISAGMNALHFSSGSVDLLGFYPEGRPVRAPLEVMDDFTAARPEHPYAKCGPDRAASALDFLRAEAEAGGAVLTSNGRLNHYHVTALGTVKPTHLSPATVYSSGLDRISASVPSIAVIGFQGFRDFHPGLAAANLQAHPLFQNCRITSGFIELPGPWIPDKAPHEIRSIDAARLFDRGDILEETGRRLDKAAAGADVIGLPGCLGLRRHGQAVGRLREITGRDVYEAPTLPPSIPGLRLDEALKKRFTDRGGLLIAGDRVIGGEISSGRLDHVHTQNYGNTRLSARAFVLASGSFFSGGLASRYDRMYEPVLGLQLSATPGRQSWSARRFFDPGGHPFLSFGVGTDDSFRPRHRRGGTVENLFCAGAVLAGYDPVLEASGGGVAAVSGLASALSAAELL